RDSKYQTRHVYADEFSSSFLEARAPYFALLPSAPEEESSNTASSIAGLEQDYASYKAYYAAATNGEGDWRLSELLGQISDLDERPTYRAKWNLAEDTNFVQGVIYMATLNPKQPACFVMLGIASWKNSDLNLAASAFEKAVALGSPQTEILKREIADL